MHDSLMPNDVHKECESGKNEDCGFKNIHVISFQF